MNKNLTFKNYLIASTNVHWARLAGFRIDDFAGPWVILIQARGPVIEQAGASVAEVQVQSAVLKD